MTYKISLPTVCFLAGLFAALPEPPAPAARADFERIVPPDKGLSPADVAALAARGAPEVYRGDELRFIGMPVGGICAGQVYLGGDGRLWHWDIFNRTSPTFGEHYVSPMLPASPFLQGFAVHVGGGGSTSVRTLDAAGFRNVSFRGEYPIGFVEYGDPDCPIRVRLVAFSPFIPLNTADSALPATIMQFTLTNVGSMRVEAGIGGWLENPVCLHSQQFFPGRRQNKVLRRSAMLGVSYAARPASADSLRGPRVQLIADFNGEDYGDWLAEGEALGSGPARGPLYPEQTLSGWVGEGLLSTYHGRDGTTGHALSPEFTITLPYLNFLISGGNHPGQTCVNLLVDGQVVRTATGANTNAMSWATWDVSDLVGRSARLEVVDNHTGGWGHIDLDEIHLSDQPAVRLFEDFERENYGEWRVEGQAFGPGPARGRLAEWQNISGYLGERCVNSYYGYDETTGRLISPEFIIQWPFINFLVGGGHHPGETCVNLLVDGAIVRTATGHNSDQLRWHSWGVYDLVGKRARIEVVDKHTGGWGHIDLDHIEFALTPKAADVVPGGLEAQPDYGDMVLALCQPTASDWAVASIPSAALPRAVFQSSAEATDVSASFPDKPVGALGRKLSLAPGKSATITFVIAWRFPNLIIGPGLRGRQYATRFPSAVEVADYVARNLDRLAAQTHLWHDTWYDSTLPYWFLNRTFANASILATSTCYLLADGRFWGWEGVGCCAGTCTHVWQYAQAVARLFPDLERVARERVDFGLAFDPASGAIGHRGEGTGPFVDGQAGSILRAYREHQMSPDDSFLRRIWPNVRRAIEWLIVLDGNDDGILEGPQPNTLDATWYGQISWISSLYLAALRAGQEMARDMGDGAFADRLRPILDAGLRNIESLFNGEYYIQVGDPAHPNQVGAYSGCHIDQVFGQSYAFQLGLGRIMNREHVLSALRSLWRYNFVRDVGPYRAANPAGRWFAVAGEPGLLMCTFPKDPPPPFEGPEAGTAGYFNECMTGFEHQVAAHMLWEGLLAEGLAVERAIHERYHPSRRNPFNEIECGDHYARAMASYGVFLAACGYEYHGPRGYIAFSPRLTPENFRAAFTAAEGWGTFTQRRQGQIQRETVELKFGRLRLRTMAFDLPAPAQVKSATVALSGKPLAAVCRIASGRVTVELESPVVILAGQRLEVVLR